MLARYFSVFDRGEIALYLIYISLISVVINIGISESTIFRIAQNLDDKGVIISKGIIFLTINYFFGLIFFLIFLVSFKLKFTFNLFASVLGIYFVSFNSFYRNVLIAEKRIFHYNLSVFIESICYLLFVLVSIFNSFHFSSIIFSYLLANVSVALIFISVRNSDFNYPNYSGVFSKLSYLNLLKDSYHFFITGLGSMLNRRAYYFLLDFFSNSNSVGVFTVTSTVPQLFENLPQQISTLAYTYISNEGNNSSATRLSLSIFRLLLYLSIAMILIISPFADMILFKVFGNQYKDYGSLLVLLSISTAILGLNGLLFNILSGLGLQKYGTFSIAISVITTLFLATFMVYRLGLFGAVLAKLIVSVIIFGYLLRCAKKELNTDYFNFFKFSRKDVDVLRQIVYKYYRGIHKS